MTHHTHKKCVELREDDNFPKKEHKSFQILLFFFIILFFTPPASVSVRRLWGPASRSSRPEDMWEGVAVMKERCRVDRNKWEHIKANFMTDLSPDAAFQRCKDDSWKAHYHRFYSFLWRFFRSVIRQDVPENIYISPAQKKWWWLQRPGTLCNGLLKEMRSDF